MSDKSDIYLGLVLVCGAFVLLKWRYARKRTGALENVARRLNLSFEAKDWGPRTPAPQLESPHFTGTPVSEAFTNTMSGKHAGFATSFFDHVVFGRDGGHTDTIAIFTQSIALPKFALSQQDTLKKIGDMIVHQEIDFPSDPAFSERFHLVATDQDGVRKLFTSDMREFLSGIEPKWRIEASGHTLVMYQGGYTVNPDEYEDFVTETTEMATEFFNNCHLNKPAF